jgi:hypothetical protein
MFRRSHKCSNMMLTTAAGLFFFCMLSPLQMENFLWGWEITYVFPEFAAAVAFACLTCYPVATMKRKTRLAKALLGLSLAAAASATVSMADGILVWPILTLLALSMTLRRRIQLLIAGVGAAIIALYLYGYHNPPYPTPPGAKILDPLRILKYVVTYFGWSWDPSLPAQSPAFSELMTGLAIAVSIGSSAWAFWRARTRLYPLRVFLAACSLFTLVAAVLTSVARLDLGIAQATTSRYQVVALLFWASFGALILSSLGQEHLGSRHMLVVQAVLLALMVASTGRYGLIARDAETRRLTLAHAYAALSYGPDDPPDLNALKPLYPVSELVPEWYAFLRAHNIGPDASEFVSKQARFVQSIPDWGGYQVVPVDNCTGFLDGVQRLTSKRALARGWAWDVAARRPPGHIVLVLPGGLVTGFGEVDTPRPDVTALLKIPELVTGWSGEALVPRGSRLRAFAVLADSRSICQLGGGLDIP